jgi:hypothetical protein
MGRAGASYGVAEALVHRIVNATREIQPPLRLETLEMMFIRKMLALSAACALGLAGLAFAPSLATAQEFRSGGSSASFQTQVLAALASMTSVSKVYRLCATGNKMGTTNACAGAAGLPVSAPISQLQNFIVIEGTMRNCGASCSVSNLGTPSGGSARYYISANGSDQGVLCTSTPKHATGFLGISGSDGILGDSDDPGNGNAMGVNGPGNGVGIPTQWPGQSGGPSGAGPTYDLTTLPRAALELCSTGLSTFVGLLPAASQPTTAGAVELCVVDIDANDDGQIGFPTSPSPLLTGRPGGWGTIGATETSNRAENCTYGLADVPPQDFADASLNSLTMDHQTAIGAQIFKLVADSNVRPSGSFFGSDSANKISLNLPQIQGIFGQANGGTDACSWKDVGGQVIGDATAKITVCFREDGSGTRETFRNTFMVQKNGEHAMGATAGTQACDQIVEGGASDVITNKTFVLSNGSGNETNCVAGTGIGTGLTGRIGYINASSKSATNAFYSVPVFGLDPDAYTADQLQNLVKCGNYPFWGPSTAGVGAAVDPGSFVNAQQHALSNVTVFNTSNSPDFIPAGDGTTGLAFIKNRTSGEYFTQFQSANCDSNVPKAPLAP